MRERFGSNSKQATLKKLTFFWLKRNSVPDLWTHSRIWMSYEKERPSVINKISCSIIWFHRPHEDDHLMIGTSIEVFYRNLWIEFIRTTFLIERLKPRGAGSKRVYGHVYWRHATEWERMSRQRKKLSVRWKAWLEGQGESEAAVFAWPHLDLHH